MNTICESLIKKERMNIEIPSPNYTMNSPTVLGQLKRLTKLNLSYYHWNSGNMKINFFHKTKPNLTKPKTYTYMYIEVVSWPTIIGGACGIMVIIVGNGLDGTRLIAFHIALIPLGKVLIQLFSLQLWVNSMTD